MSAAAVGASQAARDEASGHASPACAHCGLPVPSGLIESGAERQFCCNGCRSVWGVLHSCGLEQYYRVRASAADSELVPAATTGRRYDEFDDPTFQQLYVRPVQGGLFSTEFFLQGVHCAACVWLVEKLPVVAAGVVESLLDLPKSLVRITWDPMRIRTSAIARTLDSLGYPPHPARDVRTRNLRRVDERRFLGRIAVAGACTGNAMLLALALYSGSVSGGLSAELQTFFRWLSMAIGLLALAWPGSLFFRGAWAALRTRTPHLDLPIAIGLGVGAIAGVINTVFSLGEIYFDSLTVLVFLLLVGRWIQYRQQRGAAAGDRVAAGTISLSGRLEIITQAAGADTRVGKLMELVEHCARARPPIVRFTDRIAGWFVVAAVALSLVTLAYWLQRQPARAADNAAALLIVTCPCALGLATPLAVTVAIGRGARRRILIKGGDALEKLAVPGTIVLDKTGTITTGRTALVRWEGPEHVKPLVAALERSVNHPIARAFVDAFPNSAGLVAEEIEQQLGGGVRGLVGGHRVVIGSPAYLQSADVVIPPELRASLDSILAAGLTPVCVAVDGALAACAGLGDRVREDAPVAIARLGRLGWKVRVLSGDHPDVVAAAARRIAIPVEHAVGGATPEAKLAEIEQLVRTSPVVMVGDGVNDAAALTAATVGIAVHGGAEASLAAADVYLNRPGLAGIVELIHAARGMMRMIRIALVTSLLYNAFAASLAVTGLISPLIAAILMPISSFTVIGLAFGQRSFPRSPISARGNIINGGREPTSTPDARAAQCP
ncbi:MAG: heavy metal translocating P-type ATPase [Planctomycetes bacterium]|nr:heavy metal translocating P-type ATPase [Planctomycetota bacterium]